MLILGQLFILLLLIGSLAYIIFSLYITEPAGAPPILDLLLIGTLMRENMLITLGIIWVGALFIDCLEKERNAKQ